MPKKWDGSLKQLMGQNPEHFVRWLFPDAEFRGPVTAKPPELNDREVTRDVVADSLYQMVLFGTLCLLHIEFQSYSDPDMARRMWDYNVLATFAYKVPVYSVVIYLKPCATPEPYFEWVFPTSDVIHQFQFRVITLWKMAPETIKATGLVGIYPLMALAKNGKDKAVMEEMITGIEAEGENQKKELLQLAYLLASLVTESEDERTEIKRRFRMLEKVLRETWAWQEIMEEGRDEGLQQGLQQGLQKGLQEGVEQGKQLGREEERQQEAQRLREMFLKIVRKQFPEQLLLAFDCANEIKEPETFHNLMLGLMEVQSEEQARQFLLSLEKK